MRLDASQLNTFLLVGAAVTLLAIGAVRLSTRAGLPSLLIYLFIGVLLGEPRLTNTSGDFVTLAGTNTFERPVTLAETITTDYWGGFVGAFFKAPLAPGLTATLDTEAGLYWAHTEYSGNYSQTSIASIPSANVTQSLLLARDAPAVIASLKLGLEQDLGGIRAGVFVRGEYYSYVPSMAYNDVDRLTGLCGGRGCGGGNDGTSIGNGQMLSASFGARVTVPFGQ